MQQYIIRRTAGWGSPAELEAAAATSLEVGNGQMADDIRWIRSYVVHEPDGRLGTVCVYEATSEAKVREHAERAGLPADAISPVADTVVVRPDPERAA